MAHECRRIDHDTRTCRTSRVEHRREPWLEIREQLELRLATRLELAEKQGR
jgi:hypothetical protein